MTALRPTILLLFLVATACGGGGGACPQAQVTDDVVVSMWPSLAWTGTEYGIAWQQGELGSEEIHLVRLDQDGERIGDTVVVAEGGYPTLVWNGTGYGLAWSEEDTVHVALLEADGTMTSAISFGGAAPTLIWTGIEYAVGYVDPGGDAYLARIDAQGSSLGSQQVSFSTRARGPSLAWNGTEYGLVWHDRRDGAEGVYFASVHPTTGVSEEILLVGDGSAPSLASDGTDFALAWSERLELHFTRLTATGAPLGDSVMVSPDVFGGAALVWNGTTYGAAWIFPEQIDTRVEFAEIDGSGLPGPVTVVGDAAELGAYPSLVWNGSGYATAWGAPPYGAPEIQFSVVGCDP